MSNTITPVVNDPSRCHHALAGTHSPIILDVETTGLGRQDRLVSIGVHCDGAAHILFVGSRVTPNISRRDLHFALEPLTQRKDLTTVGHNIGFDLSVLWRAGLQVTGVIHDTEKILRLIDPDRGRNVDVLSARIDRRTPAGSPVTRLNYALKDCVLQLLDLRMVGFDSTTPMDVMPYAQHILYLTSDLLGTAALYEYLIARLTPDQLSYHNRLIQPLTPVLVAMGETGIQLDTEFVRTETHKLTAMLASISVAHQRRHGRPLLGMNDAGTVSWLFGILGIRPRQRQRPTPAQRRSGMMGDPSLSTAHLQQLVHIYAAHPRVVSSLNLIRRYRQARFLLSGLGAVADHVDYRDGRVHTMLRDSLATGRISSTAPNLQGIARRQIIAGAAIRSRNLLMASEGFSLVSFDIKEADIRVEANAVAAFPSSAQEHLQALRDQRLAELAPYIGLHLAQLKAHHNSQYQSLGGTSEPTFLPDPPCALGKILHRQTGDPYLQVAEQLTALNPAQTISRKTAKVVTLSMANSITAVGLARRLGYSDDAAGRAQATRLMRDFWHTYPKVAAFTELMRWQVALTGMTETWAGRTRICSAHRWLVTLPRVEILISFKGPEWLLMDVVLLRPLRHGITCWIRKVWDYTKKSGNYKRLVYEDVRGALCTKPYRIFQTHPPLMYQLPIRNISWRSIRKVRTDSEEAQYHGFDTTARSLINHIYQGGTADVSKVMMLRCQSYCRWVGAKLLLNIHDEVLFEVPSPRVSEFIRTMRRLLELPPTPTWQIPIRVDAKYGTSFGAMKSPSDR
jgi:DNA polymerase I-like protein with 3'-5' exonuclease and polymerase domains